MPTITRRERVTGEVDVPSVIVTMVGPESIMHWGYYGPGQLHFLGNNGPRGGHKTVCGKRIPRRWSSIEFFLPVPEDRYTPRRWRWNYLCDDCKTGVMRVANPGAPV